jgi:hypothetical protein
MRILPHDQNTGGFFVAVLQKSDGGSKNETIFSTNHNDIFENDNKFARKNGKDRKKRKYEADNDSYGSERKGADRSVDASASMETLRKMGYNPKVAGKSSEVSSVSKKRDNKSSKQSSKQASKQSSKQASKEGNPMTKSASDEAGDSCLFPQYMHIPSALRNHLLDSLGVDTGDHKSESECPVDANESSVCIHTSGHVYMLKAPTMTVSNDSGHTEKTSQASRGSKRSDMRREEGQAETSDAYEVVMMESNVARAVMSWERDVVVQAGVTVASLDANAHALTVDPSGAKFLAQNMKSSRILRLGARDFLTMLACGTSQKASTHDLPVKPQMRKLTVSTRTGDDIDDDDDDDDGDDPEAVLAAVQAQKQSLDVSTTCEIQIRRKVYEEISRCVAKASQQTMKCTTIVVMLDENCKLGKPQDKASTSSSMRTDTQQRRPISKAEKKRLKKKAAKAGNKAHKASESTTIHTEEMINRNDMKYDDKTDKMDDEVGSQCAGDNERQKDASRNVNVHVDALATVETAIVLRYIDTSIYNQGSRDHDRNEVATPTTHIDFDFVTYPDACASILTCLEAYMKFECT